MGFKDLHLKLKTFRLKRFLLGDVGRNKEKESENVKRLAWMMPVSHGFHVVEEGQFGNSSNGGDQWESDRVVVQREEIENNEWWFFGVFDAGIGSEITKYLQAHLFKSSKKFNELRRRSKEILRKAHLNARAKLREPEKQEESKSQLGTASAIVINGEKLVMANMGDYKAIICRNGEPYPINKNHRQDSKRHWIWKFFQGKSKPAKSSELAVVAQRIDSDTEFVILGSTGIWEVMKHQEAVNLIRHIEDPQEAAECLAKEALTRLSRTQVSCLIIRFD